MSRRLPVVRDAGFSRSRLVSRRVKPGNRMAGPDTRSARCRDADTGTDLLWAPMGGRRGSDFAGERD